MLHVEFGKGGRLIRAANSAEWIGVGQSANRLAGNWINLQIPVLKQPQRTSNPLQSYPFGIGVLQAIDSAHDGQATNFIDLIFLPKAAAMEPSTAIHSDIHVPLHWPGHSIQYAGFFRLPCWGIF